MIYHVQEQQAIPDRGADSITVHPSSPAHIEGLTGLEFGVIFFICALILYVFGEIMYRHYSRKDQ